MATIESSSSLISQPPKPAGAPSQAAPAPASPSPNNGGYELIVKEFTPDGKSVEIKAPMPLTGNFEEWSLMTQVVMLKKGSWSKASIPEILWGVAYSAKLGLDIMAGDVYSVGDGRIATSNKAKIKMAFATGRIKGFSADIIDTKKPIDLPGCIQKTDLECTVTLEVEGLNKPIVRKALLSRWFVAKNPNWTGRPEHMLELNTMAHACEYVHPTETGPDEFEPPQPEPTLQSPKDIVAELRQAKLSESIGSGISSTPSLSQMVESATPANSALTELVKS